MRHEVGKLGAQVVYVAGVGVLAGAGAVLEQPQYYLAAVVLTLPFGLAALVGAYLGYALVQALGGLFVASTTADGSQALWLSVASGSLNVVLLTAAAAGDVLLLRALGRRARRVRSTPVVP